MGGIGERGVGGRGRRRGKDKRRDGREGRREERIKGGWGKEERI